MNSKIIKEISSLLSLSEKSILAVLKLLEDGNTIPFIARYRKEATGGVDEEQIRKINEYYEYQVNLLQRKEDIIRLIDEKGLMTEELKEKILSCQKLVEVEDLYRPYKEKKKTKATEAINNGLEGLAKEMLSFYEKGDINTLVNKYLSDKVKTIEEAVMGAEYIIAEYISDNASYRKWIRKNTYINGEIVSKLKKDSKDENKTYEMYYDFKEPVREVKPHRILALNRGEKEKILNVSINTNEEEIIKFLKEKVIKRESFVNEYVVEAIIDSYKRLIKPSIEREIRSDLTEKANVVAIENFSKNLEKLLLQPPMKEKNVMGLDPAYRTGCKLAVIDSTGKRVEIAKIYPHEPVNKYEEAKKITIDLINKYNIDIIAIGNGTASRESEAFIADVIKNIDRKVEYVIVSEAGASVYSASKVAIEEFPDLHVEERSAISIGRRLQDPLSELVKIDPQSIGVGLYQHDIPNKKLSDSLDFVVSCAVNSVGVNVNTASPFLLKYVSGMNKRIIDKIIDYRNKLGKIKTREEIKKIVPSKSYEQCIGFLRILDGKNILDQTSIHPESYEITFKLLEKLGFSLDDIGTENLKKSLDKMDINEFAKTLNTDIYTLEDIVKSLIKPNRDPRDVMPTPLLRSDILHIEDLSVGMKLQGTVRNVAPFGVFIDIGLKNDALVHISHLANHYVKDPMEVVNVGDIVDCYVYEIFKDKNKVSLSLIEV
ncbi:MAG: RNA-binding transcriptional accessory protein [Clostridium sp.]|nr:RNA-binding transcriptional accessory protein [Clostridium sp.]MCM1444432.1 RNA-binding transcriptional accessory protein [Candidatus Amulumruptor caecigallinarius]